MKHTLATFSLASLVAAQTGIEDLTAQMPDCTWLQCLLQGIGNTDCELEDLACVCGSFNTVAEVAVPCLQSDSNCSSNQTEQAVLATRQFCIQLDSDASMSLPVVVTTSTETETVAIETETETVTSSPTSTETESEPVTGTATESPTGTSDGGEDDGDDDSAGSRAQVASFGLAAALMAAMAL